MFIFKHLEGQPQRLWPSLLHLLIVEDVPEDAELIELALLTAGLEFTYDIAETEAQCWRQLQNPYDAILADYRLPGFDGLQAFQLLQASGQDIPFILVTGSLGEEAAVECLKAGITDYVLKERLFRLPAILTRALEEFAVRRQNKAAIAKLQASAWRDAIINRIVQSMRGTLVLDEVLKTTVEQLHEALQVNRCLIFLPDPQQEMRAEFISEATTERKSLVGISCEFYRHYHNDFVRGELLRVSHIDDRLTPTIQTVARDYQIRSILITPLLYQQSYVGGITLHQCDREREWTEEEVALVRSIADHCAIAIHQAQLYQQAQTELQERQRIERVLRRSEQRFRALIENATDIIVSLDAQFCIGYASPSIERILGYPPTELIGQSLLDLIHFDERTLLTETLQWSLKSLGISHPAVECRLRTRLGTWRVLEVVATNLLNDPSVDGIVLNCHEITERKQAEEQLRHDALHDTLTGLANRSLLIDRLEQALKRSKRGNDRYFAVLFLDLDRFKIINDSLGHLIGDRLLLDFARRLEENQRTSDTIARLGGDEFVILLEDLIDLDEAIQVAERVHQILAVPFKLENREIFISASIGIAISSSYYSQSVQILRDADTAMYYAKARGKARYAVFAPSMHVRAVRQFHLESDLRLAIERQELIVYYQPIVSLATRQIQGVEALVRWKHPNQGIVPPSEFIFIAEETGTIVDLDRYVLRAACQQMQRWLHQFPRSIPFTLSVNLSGKQFSQPNLIEQIDLILAETGLDGSYLKLEITESVLIENPKSAAVMIEQLQQRNIEICLDDFGTGYSSLSYLHRFPLNILKIDRSFVSNLEVNRSNLTIVRTIVTMANELGIRIVAEGVETAEQAAFLQSLNCHYGQGYWFSPPLDTHTMTALLETI